MEILVGIVIGLVLGLTGAGGSVFAVPLLIWLVGLEPSQAIGISLGAVAAGALFGVIARLRSSDIQWLPAVVFAVLSAIVTPVGIWLNQQIDQRWLMIGFGLLVIVIAVRLWLQTTKSPDAAAEVRARINAPEEVSGAVCRMIGNNPFKLGLPCILGISGGAIVTGILSGLFGVGGGFIIVPTLMFLTGISIRQAVATSLVVITVIGISGFTGFLISGGNPGWMLLGQVAIGSIIGMFAGVFLSKHISGCALQRVFVVLMLIMAIGTLIDNLF